MCTEGPAQTGSHVGSGGQGCGAWRPSWERTCCLSLISDIGGPCRGSGQTSVFLGRCFPLFICADFLRHRPTLAGGLSLDCRGRAASTQTSPFSSVFCFHPLPSKRLVHRAWSVSGGSSPEGMACSFLVAASLPVSSALLLSTRRLPSRRHRISLSRVPALLTHSLSFCWGLGRKQRCARTSHPSHCPRATRWRSVVLYTVRPAKWAETANSRFRE